MHKKLPRVLTDVVDYDKRTTHDGRLLQPGDAVMLRLEICSPEKREDRTIFIVGEVNEEGWCRFVNGILFFPPDMMVTAYGNSGLQSLH